MSTNKVAILKKSQIMIEFVLITGIVLATAVIFIAALSQNKALHRSNEFFLVKDVALKIQNEISVTSYIEDGYSRQFELPEKINNKDYNISIINNTLTVWTNTTSFVAPILNITGYLKKETNTITKANGVTYIN